jgi:hypothetical protein
MPSAAEKLKNKLGESMTAQEVADYLKLDVKTVRMRYEELGGVRIGHKYLFFENLIVKEVSNAILQQKEEGPAEVGCVHPADSRGPGLPAGTSLHDRKRSEGVGINRVEPVRRRVFSGGPKDKHGVLPA